MAQVVCNYQTLKSKLEDIRERLENEDLSRSERKKLRAEEKKLEKELGKVEPLFKKAKKAYEKLLEARKIALEYFGKKGLKEIHLRALSPRERLAHTVIRVKENLAAGEYYHAWGAVRRYVASFNDPLEVAPISAFSFAKPKRQMRTFAADEDLSLREDVPNLPKNKTIVHEIDKKGPINPSVVRSRFMDIINTVGFDYDVEYVGDKTIYKLTDKVTGRTVTAEDEISIILKGDELMRARRNDVNLDPPGELVFQNLKGLPPEELSQTPIHVLERIVKAAAPNADKPMEIVLDRLKQLDPNLAEIPRPKAISVTGLINRMVTIGIGFNNRLNNAYNAIRKEMGLPPKTLPYLKAFNRAQQEVLQAERWLNINVKKPLVKAMKKFKISGDYETQHRIHQALIKRDEWMERTYKKFTKEDGHTNEEWLAVKDRFLKDYEKQIWKEFSITENEAKYIKVLDDLFYKVGEFSETPDLELRRGYYYPRYQRMSDAFYQGLGERSPTIEDVASIDPQIYHHYSMMQRISREGHHPRFVSALIDRIMSEVVHEDATFGRHYFAAGEAMEVLMRHARNVSRRKMAGQYIADTLANIHVRFPDPDAQNWALRGAEIYLNDVPIDKLVADRVMRDTLSLMSIPTESQFKRNLDVRRQRQRIMRRMKPIIDKMKKRPYLKPFVGPLQKFYETLGISLTKDRVLGLWEIFSHMHRSTVFGANIMASKRDTVSTAMLHYLNASHKDFASSFYITYIDAAFHPFRWLRRFREMRDAGIFDDVMSDIATPELEDTFGNKYLSVLDRIQVMYKFTDVLTRMQSHFIAERAAKRAIKNWNRWVRKGGEDYAKIMFLKETHLDMGVEYMAQEAVEQMMTSLKEGNFSQLVKHIRHAHEAKTAFFYARWNAAPFMDYAPGRVFGMYGSWALNNLSAMWHQFVAPWKLYGFDNNILGIKARPDLAVKRTMSTALKWMIASEAIYSLGGVFGINTSGWIPFVHNSIPSLGPMAPIVEKLRGLASGDPDTIEFLQDRPGLFLMSLARGIIPGFPIPGLPNSVRKVIAQLGVMDDEEVAQFFGLPPERDKVINKIYAALGFMPYDDDVEIRWREGGATAEILQHYLAPIHNKFSEATGGVVPPVPED